MAKSSGMKWDFSNLSKNLLKFESKAQIAIEIKVNKYASRLQSQAKINAKWTDRTGEARRRLNSSYEKVSEGYKLILAHGVEYGIWLELANEKRFSIIPQTIEYVGTFEIIPDFENFINKLSI